MHLINHPKLTDRRLRPITGRRRLWLWIAVCLAGDAALQTAYAADNVDQASVPGGVYVWTLAQGAEDVRFDGKPVLTTSSHALVGIPMTQSPGDASLTFRVDGIAKTHTFAVTPKAYTEQRLTIENQAMVTPPAETLKRIRSEATRQRRLYNRYLAEFHAADGFHKPLDGITTSLFGHRRILNGKPRSPHSGLDIAAPTGTPVAAAGAGVVTLADELYFNGKTVFVDHGRGLITMYCHLSELKAAEGEWVDLGQIIGLVGATGRVTGPHLHWSVSLNGNRVDPTTFMQLFNQLTARFP